jgi:hypothetical protein
MIPPPRPTITIPIRCSTVKRINNIAIDITVIEAAICGWLALAFAVANPYLGNTAVGAPISLLMFVGFVANLIISKIVVVYILERIPRLECIKDKETP